MGAFRMHVWMDAVCMHGWIDAINMHGLMYTWMDGRNMRASCMHAWMDGRHLHAWPPNALCTHRYVCVWYTCYADLSCGYTRVLDIMCYTRANYSLGPQLHG